VEVLFHGGRDLKDVENWIDQVEKKGDFKSPRLQKPLFWKDVQKKDGWQKEVEEDEMDVDIVASYGEESQAKSGKRHKRGPSEVTASTRTTARSGSSPRASLRLGLRPRMRLLVMTACLRLRIRSLTLLTRIRETIPTPLMARSHPSMTLLTRTRRTCLTLPTLRGTTSFGDLSRELGWMSAQMSLCCIFS